MPLLLVGCQAPKPAALTNTQVAAVTANVLEAIDAGNYAAFTRDFSSRMKSAFPEAEFDKVRSMLQAASGSYVSLSAPTLTDANGYAAYRILCKYTQETVAVTITFQVGGDQVEGLFFDSANLRKAVP